MPTRAQSANLIISVRVNVRLVVIPASMSDAIRAAMKRSSDTVCGCRSSQTRQTGVLINELLDSWRRPCFNLVCLDSCTRLPEHSNAAPVEVHGVLGSGLRRQWLLIIWSRRQAADTDLRSVRSQLVRRMTPPSIRAMTLPKRKVTAQIAVNRSC